MKMRKNDELEGQLSIFDCVTPVPQLHDCYKTCKHFGERVDYPEWWFGKARCLLQTGDHTHEVEFDNMSFMYCDLYEEEGKNKDA